MNLHEQDLSLSGVLPNANNEVVLYLYEIVRNGKKLNEMISKVPELFSPEIGMRSKIQSRLLEKIEDDVLNEIHERIQRQKNSLDDLDRPITSFLN